MNINGPGNPYDVPQPAPEPEGEPGGTQEFANPEASQDPLAISEEPGGEIKALVTGLGDQAGNSKALNINEDNREPKRFGDKLPPAETSFKQNASIGSSVVDVDFDGRRETNPLENLGEDVTGVTVRESGTTTVTRGFLDFDSTGQRAGFSEQTFTGEKAELRLRSDEADLDLYAAAGLTEKHSLVATRTENGGKAELGGEFFLGSEVGFRASYDHNGGPLNVSSSGRARAGVSGEGKGSIEIDKTSGVKAELSGEVFAGYSAEFDTTGSIGDSAKVGVGAELNAGIGAEFKARGEISRERIGVEFNVGATLGIGGSVKFDASINPVGILDDIKDVKELTDAKREELTDAAKERFDDFREDVGELRDKAMDGARDRIDGVKDRAGELRDNVKDAARDKVDEMKDTIGGWFD